jgi:hypothetical protein
LRSLARFSASTTGNGEESIKNKSPSGTWPLKSANGVLLERAEAFGREVEERSPTKMGRGGGRGKVLVEEGREVERGLATRYVLVEGLERGSTEEDLRDLLVVRSPFLPFAFPY